MSIRHLRDHLGTEFTFHALESVMRAVDRHLKALSAVKTLSTAEHAWCRQGGSSNQPDRDRYEHAVNERDAAAGDLHAMIEAWER